ncbi:MAG: hypothetical protein KatS3mg038_2346 [Candidatus Kapaibacterium sp.]|nr:MAG: hypothetical protein KatS3mg038_2346 [Candidatus Kapabacteria bacterium]
MVYACAIALLMLVGCCTQQPTVRTQMVRDTIVTLAPVVVRDTVAARVEGDSVVGMRVRERDTVVRVVYAPARKQIAVHVKTDTLRLRVRDTVTLSPPVVTVETTPLWAYISAAVAALALLTLLLRR